MNFLLHCWLGRSDRGLKAGGFLGDFIKGKLDDDIPDDLKQGLLLHRYIDVESNRMPSMRATYHRFGAELRRPAPILLDLMADHVFAKHWQEFAHGDLPKFTQTCYLAIGSFDVPTSAQRLFNHMCDSDLLARYAQLEVVEEIMLRMLKRLRFHHMEEHLAQLLRDQEMVFKDDFSVYFNELEAKAKAWLEGETSS